MSIMSVLRDNQEFTRQGHILGKAIPANPAITISLPLPPLPAASYPPLCAMSIPTCATSHLGYCLTVFNPWLHIPIYPTGLWIPRYQTQDWLIFAGTLMRVYQIDLKFLKDNIHV